MKLLSYSLVAMMVLFGLLIVSYPAQAQVYQPDVGANSEWVCVKDLSVYERSYYGASVSIPRLGGNGADGECPSDGAYPLANGTLYQPTDIYESTRELCFPNDDGTEECITAYECTVPFELVYLSGEKVETLGWLNVDSTLLLSRHPENTGEWVMEHDLDRTFALATGCEQLPEKENPFTQ